MKELAERYGQIESQFCPAQVYIVFNQHIH